MRYIIIAVFLLVGHAASAQDLRLPFNGRWFVMQGGDTPNVNQHMTVAAQAYGVDFAKVGGPSQRQLAFGTPSKIEDFFSWGEPVLSPADGTVVFVVNDRPDNPLGVKDAEHPAGNYLVIAIAGGRVVYLAHMQRGSVSVKAGDAVKCGQRVGLCGNSGNSDFPHIHLHVQDTPDLNVGLGQNPIFGPINVELTGKQFIGVTWPLIRGLFVWNP
jgi:hypothetical protein